MQILSVVKIKAYSRYGYDYLSEIVLRRADLQEHTIAEKDFKNLHPSDFEDLNLLFLQGHLDHLPGFDKKMLSTIVKLWTRNLVIRQRVEDFQLDQFQEDPPPESPMADNRTMAQLLQAPTEGYKDAIVIPETTANNFELKHEWGKGAGDLDVQGGYSHE
nr:reverse transcriptase domain-containing protein [Tanacetum cinerariifolium]